MRHKTTDDLIVRTSLMGLLYFIVIFKTYLPSFKYCRGHDHEFMTLRRGFYYIIFIQATDLYG